MRHLAAILFLLLAITAAPVRAAHTEAKLFLSAAVVRPGDTLLAGVHLKMEPGWHTYWKNPGESGQATEIKWQLPAGVTAGEIQWPLPEKLPPVDVTTYGYEDEIVLLVPLKLNATLPAGTLNLAAKVTWLECKESCIPGGADIQATLTVGQEGKASADAARFESWRSKLPQTTNHFSLQAWWETSKGDTRPLNLGNPATDADKNLKYDAVEFFPDANDAFEVAASTEVVSAYSAQLHLRKLVKKFSGDWPKEISGVLVVQQGKTRSGYELKLPIADKPATPAAGTSASASPPAASAAPALPPLKVLLIQLLAALGGGIIMNLMPCVLPILSLKILSLVQQHGQAAAVARRHSLVYLLGVLVSFWVIAGLVIAGRLASWGEQFQDARFVVIITVLMTVIALNLFGLFEFILPGKAVGSAAELAGREGGSGAFFNGVLAVVLGASCVAPLMATAIGWAITQSPLVIALVFTAIGLGLALPYVLLTFFPTMQRLLPRPGAWMEKFKIALGFPMLGMAAWAFSLVVVHHGQRGALWVGMFLVAVGLGAWVFGEFIQRGSRRKWLAWLVVLAGVGGGYGYALEYELDWRHPVIETSRPGGVKIDAGGIEWSPWSAATVAEAQASGKIVLVDFTADWCLTCQVNKKTSLEIDSVRKRLKELNVAPLIGDNTRKNDDITAELKHFERAGVPLVLVYSKDPRQPPQILPTVLTPGSVLDALNRASQP